MNTTTTSLPQNNLQQSLLGSIRLASGMDSDLEFSEPMHEHFDVDAIIGTDATTLSFDLDKTDSEWATLLSLDGDTNFFDEDILATSTQSTSKSTHVDFLDEVSLLEDIELARETKKNIVTKQAFATNFLSFIGKQMVSGAGSMLYGIQKLGDVDVLTPNTLTGVPERATTPTYTDLTTSTISTADLRMFLMTYPFVFLFIVAVLVSLDFYPV